MEPTAGRYQLTIIGGFTDGFHFRPVIVHGNAATIYPHHDLLRYGKTYYVQIDPGVLTAAGDGFNGVAGTHGDLLGAVAVAVEAGLADEDLRGAAEGLAELGDLLAQRLDLLARGASRGLADAGGPSVLAEGVAQGL